MLRSRCRTSTIPACVTLAMGCTGQRDGNGAFEVGTSVSSGASSGVTTGEGSASGTAGSTEGSMVGETGDTGRTEGPSDPEDASSGNPGSTASTPSSDTSGTVKFDTPVGEEGADSSAGEGCEKVDFLFVIDSSSSMKPEQTLLINAFGPFMDTISSMLTANDYHIMVLDSDSCPVAVGGFGPQNYDPTADNDCATKYACEGTLGAGQVRGCPVPDGARYLTSTLDAATLESTFSCVANVGAEGSPHERPMMAMTRAVTVERDACNAGFLRDDAILVVTIISDDGASGEADDLSQDEAHGFGSPQTWRDTLVEAKGGVAQNIVAVGFFDDPPGLSGTCTPAGGPVPGHRFVEFIKLFGNRGLLGHSCGPDYNVLFQQAVSLIDTTCKEYVPPE